MSDRGNLPDNFIILGPGGRPPAASPGDRGNLPSTFVIQPPQTRAEFAQDQTPSADLTGTVGNFLKGPLATMAVRGITGIPDALSDPLSPLRHLISPELEAMEQSVRPGSQAGTGAFNLSEMLGGPGEYQATTPTGRVGMAAGTGAISAGPLGLLRSGITNAGTAVRAIPGALGALSSSAGQIVRENLPGYERLAGAAEQLPGAAVAARRALGPRRAEVPGTEELHNIGERQFGELPTHGVEVDRPELVRLANDTINRLDTQGVDIGLDIPKTLRVISERIDKPGAGPLTMDQVHTIRKAIGVILDASKPARDGSGGNPTETRAALALRDTLDEYVLSIPDNPHLIRVGAPNAEAAAAAYRKALGNYAASMRSDKLTGDLAKEGEVRGILGQAEGAAEAQGTERNFDRALRAKLLAMSDKKGLQGYGPEERAAIEAARKGSFTRNRLRDLAAVLGGGPSWKSLLGGSGAGYMAHASELGPLATTGIAMVPPAIGAAARSGQNALARRSLQEAATQSRMNSPEYQDRLANMPSRDRAVLMALAPGLLAPQQPPQAGPNQNPFVDWMQQSGFLARR